VTLFNLSCLHGRITQRAVFVIGGNLAEFWCQSQWQGVRIECVGYASDYSKPVGKMPPVQRGLW
jgi:hypothetical protein